MAGAVARPTEKKKKGGNKSRPYAGMDTLAISQ